MCKVIHLECLQWVVRNGPARGTGLKSVGHCELLTCDMFQVACHGLQAGERARSQVKVTELERGRWPYRMLAHSGYGGWGTPKQLSAVKHSGMQTATSHATLVVNSWF